MRRALSLAVVVLLAAAACSRATADGDALVPALCDAVAADDTTTAADVFEDRVHGPLHTLAADLETVDRGLAARLLEAKFDVETVVRADDPGPAPLVHDRLTTLLDRVREGLQALDRPAPTC